MRIKGQHDGDFAVFTVKPMLTITTEYLHTNKKLLLKQQDKERINCNLRFSDISVILMARDCEKNPRDSFNLTSQPYENVLFVT